MKADILGGILAIFGAAFLWRAHPNYTTPILIAGIGCIALGFYLMDSTDFKAFVGTIGGYLPWGHGRKDGE